jgi:tetratricopeptide (TPR) repeat protein
MRRRQRAARPAEAIPRGRGARSRRAWSTLLAAALVGWACSRPAPSPAPPAGRRIVLIGLDGADWLAIDALVAEGRLPTFARLAARGRSALLITTPPLVSPLVWTTIATGRQPEDHGVLDFMLDRADGGQAPVSSEARRVAALWNIFSDAGRSVAVVGWWATAPAERVRGTLVSDRVAPQLLRAAAPPDADAVYPPAAWAGLSGDVVRAGALGRDDLARYVPLSPAEFEAARRALGAPSATPLYSDRFAHLAAVVAGTRTYAALGERLLAAGQPDFAALYFEGIDTVSHLFVRTPHAAQAIAAAYADADALVARLAARVAPDTLVVVCSDHGFHPPDAGITADPAQLAGPATAWHRPYGVLAVAEAGHLVGATGAPATPSSSVRPRATPLDVAPTLLHAAGLPVGREMPGRVLRELLPSDVGARPERRAPTPPRPPLSATLRTGGPDPDAVARLQALGYLGATPTSLARQNLGESLYRRGRLPAAERELRAVTEAQPTNLAAHLWLARALADQRRADEALRVYESAVQLPGGRDDALIVAVELALAARRPAAAQRLIAKAGGPDTTASAVARALVHAARGRTAAAEAELRAALRREPTSFDALSHLFDLLARTRRAAALVPLVERAAGAAPRSPRLVALLGETWLAAGDAGRAEQALGRALELAPDATAVRLDLARARLVAGRAQDALATLEAAEDTPERRALQGAACASLQDWPRAAEHYRQALRARPEDAPLLNALAWAELQRGHAREAGELLRRSLGVDADQPEIRKLLAGLAQGTS